MKGAFSASAAGCAAGLADALFGRSRRLIRCFIAPSESMRRILVSGGMPQGRVAHVPHFVDANAIRPASSVGAYILFMGRLVPQKGIMTFLEAARRLPDIPFRIVGSGPLEPMVRAQVQCQRLRNVEVLGHKGGGELLEIVRSARAIAAPSEWYEPFSLVILEAMAAARAVIATRIGGPAEIISHGEDGVLVLPGDPQALAEACCALWQNPELAVEMGRRGREKVCRLYAPDLHYERMMGVFRKAIS